jgi:hypothetical protein
MSYHSNNSSSARRSSVNRTQQQVQPTQAVQQPLASLPIATQQQAVEATTEAPLGYHYMPDGTLMADSEMEVTKAGTTFYNPYERDPVNVSNVDNIGVKKIVSAFVLDLSPLPAKKVSRSFLIKGDVGATFDLEIKNEDNYYYNFVTGAFQVIKAGLYKEVVIAGGFKGDISFPEVTSNDQYNISLSVDPLTTKHQSFKEVRFEDGTLDINSSSGSNSLLMTKVIYQYTDHLLTISTYSPGGTVAVAGQVNSTIALSKDSTASKQPFSVSCSVSGDIPNATTCYTIVKQPTEYDIIAFVQPVVGSAPITISGENIYPAVTGTDTVDGAVSSGVKVVMDTNVATKMKLGDRITGNAALNAATVTVVALNPDEDNPKEFSMSEAIDLADGLALSFSNQMNYRWPINKFADVITDGMVVVAGTSVTAGTFTGEYEDATTIFPDTYEEYKIIKKAISSIDTLAKKPTIVKGEITVQEGAVVFDKQQELALAGTTLKVGGYGTHQIKSVYGYDLIFSDLAITLTPVTTTTTAASAGGSSANVVVASRTGILDDVSTVSGIGINPRLANPIVDSGAGAVAGAGTIVLDAAQSLESGITLTFANAGLTATITGNIQVLKAGNAAQTLRFDVDKLLSVT